MQAGLELFADLGYQKTSIARIEAEAGLVPRAGAFYRHFESKEALLAEIARTYVSETPENFGLDRLVDYGDTRAELIAIALRYEESMIRQKPYARLIEEIRLLDFGADLQNELDRDMLLALEAWIKTKPAAKDLPRKQSSALLISVLGGWLHYLAMARRGAQVGTLRDSVLEEWATIGASFLDTPR